MQCNDTAETGKAVDPRTATKDTKENAKEVNQKGIGGQPSIVLIPGIVSVAAMCLQSRSKILSF